MILQFAHGEMEQHLVPVLSSDQALRGIVMIPNTKFQGSEQELTIEGKSYVAKAIRFFDADRHVDRLLFCIVVDFSNNAQTWLSIPGLIPPSKFGILGAWAIPVGKQKHIFSLGLAELLTRTIYDKFSVVQSKSSRKTYSVSLAVNVSKQRFAERLSSIEFMWDKMLACHLDKRNMKDEFLDVRIDGVDDGFRAVCFSNAVGGLPSIMRIMALHPIDNGTYRVLWFVTGKNADYQVTLSLRVK